MFHVNSTYVNFWHIKIMQHVVGCISCMLHFITICDILQHKLYSVITFGVMLQINLKLVLVLVLHCNLPSQIVTPLERPSEI